MILVMWTSVPFAFNHKSHCEILIGSETKRTLPLTLTLNPHSFVCFCHHQLYSHFQRMRSNQWKKQSLFQVRLTTILPMHKHSCCVTARSLCAGATMISQQDTYPFVISLYFYFPCQALQYYPIIWHESCKKHLSKVAHLLHNSSYFHFRQGSCF